MPDLMSVFPIPWQETLEGCRLSIENAERLAQDSQVLRADGRLQTAYSVSLDAWEEMGKAIPSHLLLCSSNLILYNLRNSKNYNEGRTNLVFRSFIGNIRMFFPCILFPMVHLARNHFYRIILYF